MTLLLKKILVVADEGCIRNPLFSSKFTNGRNKLVFVPGRPFQLSLMFASKGGAYLSMVSKLLDVCTNIRLGLPGTNTLAF